jgi:hypothetical protein
MFCKEESWELRNDWDGDVHLVSWTVGMIAICHKLSQQILYLLLTRMDICGCVGSN